VSADDPLAQAISDWQRKHRIGDDDPMIAVLELVRIHLRHTRDLRDDRNWVPPIFEDFRGTIELLDRRSKAFIHQASDLLAELRRFGLNVQRINRARLITPFMCAVLGAVVGALLIRVL
jgi:hypothetical protein